MKWQVKQEPIPYHQEYPEYHPEYLGLNELRLGLIIYTIVMLIVYVIFKLKKREHPFMNALKISWIWGIIIALVLYFLYYIFVGSCTHCAYGL